VIDHAASGLEHAARLGTSSTVAMVSVEAPVLDAAAVAAGLAGDLRSLWRGSDGELIAGAGVVARVSATGAHRFAWARDRARRLFARLTGEARLFGGFAFATAAPAGALAPAGGQPWIGFADASFELARIAYERAGDRATLSVAVANPLDPRSRQRGLTELEAALERLDRCGRRGPADAGPALGGDLAVPVNGEGARGYLELVARARGAVRAGELDKVVVARRADVAIAPADRTEAIAELLGSLDRAYPSCTVLCRASDRGAEHGVLIAASPERLVRVSGERVATAALAGTAPADRAAALFSSSKLQLEHELTSRHIAAALESAGCIAVEVAPQRLRRLGDLAHLETTIAGGRPAGAHLFDLAAALHPTPAVAGIPTAAACRFIDRHEAMARGWYAGPVGWLDRRGDGELAVALRVGLVARDHIHLYAGAGIVGESVPAEELAETTLKLGALGRRLSGGAA
jgi:isochorismate synthase